MAHIALHLVSTFMVNIIISLKTIENVIGPQSLSRLNHYHLRHLEIFYLCENDEWGETNRKQITFWPHHFPSKILWNCKLHGLDLRRNQSLLLNSLSPANGGQAVRSEGVLELVMMCLYSQLSHASHRWKGIQRRGIGYKGHFNQEELEEWRNRPWHKI